MAPSDLFLTLTPERVLAAVEAGNLECNNLCYPLNSFENRVYEVELTDHSRVVAKFYRPGRWREEHILEEHRFNFHPHVHVLVTDGAFAPDGTFRPLAWFHSEHVERLFRAEVLRMLLGKELITEAVVDNLLSWRHSGFSAHGAVRVEDR